MLQTGTPIISARDLNVIYFPGKSNEVTALKHIELDIYPGEFIIFFGPSGCGKSTLLYSISGLETKITGDILVGGKNLATMTMSEREVFHQTMIGMVFQAYYLIPSINILQNVALPQMALRRKKRERDERALQLLTKFGVGAQSHKLPMELSGGQQQRVAISRSLMNNPSIIVADEPVGNLDTKSSGEVMQMLRELNDVDKKTVILVTHDPTHIHHAHRVFYMRDGQIIETKTNSDEDRQKSVVMTVGEQMKPDVLQNWAKTYALKKPVEGLSDSDILETHEMLIGILAGYTVEEIGTLENLVQQLLHSDTTDEEAIFQTLHESIKDGGLAVDVRVSKRIAHRISETLLEAERLRTIEQGAKKEHHDPFLEEAKEIRTYILDALHIQLPQAESIPVIDAIVRDFLAAEIDHLAVFERLDLPLSKNGAGLNKRVAKKFLRQLKMLVVEKEVVKKEEPKNMPPPLAPVSGQRPEANEGPATSPKTESGEVPPQPPAETEPDGPPLSPPATKEGPIEAPKPPPESENAAPPPEPEINDVPSRIVAEASSPEEESAGDSPQSPVPETEEESPELPAGEKSVEPSPNTEPAEASSSPSESSEKQSDALLFSFPIIGL